jgi:hypothetical protein
MGNNENKPQDVKPETDKPRPDPTLISHIEKGYTPEGLEKREKK